MALTKNQRRTTNKKQNTEKSFLVLKSAPRLSVFRSNKEIYAPLVIDDVTGKTIAVLHLPEIKILVLQKEPNRK